MISGSFDIRSSGTLTVERVLGVSVIRGDAHEMGLRIRLVGGATVTLLLEMEDDRLVEAASNQLNIMEKK